MKKKPKVEERKGISFLAPFLTVSRNEILAVLFIFILMNIITATTQNITKTNGGRGWDGTYYYQLAEQITEKKRPEAPSPLVFRVGTSYLAAWVSPHDILKGFLIVNLAAALLIVVLLELWLGCWIQDWKIRLLVNILLQTNWIGPVRYIWFYRTLSDFWPIVFILAALIVIAKTKNLFKMTMGVGVLSVLGVLFREFVFVLPASFVFMGLRLGALWTSFWKKFYLKIIPLAAAGIAWLLLRQTVNIVPDNYTYANKAWVELSNLKTVPMWFLGLFGTYGPALVAILLAPKTIWRFFRGNLHLLALLIGTLILSRIGGEDYERFVLWALPLFYLLIGLALDSRATVFRYWWALVLLLGCQAISQRVLWTIPEDGGGEYQGFLVSAGSQSRYLSLFGCYESPDWAHKRLVEYLAVCLFFILADLFIRFSVWKIIRKSLGFLFLSKTPKKGKRNFSPKGALKVKRA